MATKVFKGANVFMSRNLVPPELFDALHDALKLNGAQVFLCCNPDRNGPNDYHVIASPENEKFEDLRSRGCNLIGPQCVFSCAKEHRVLPTQGFTCCLAMDGVNILASGFEMDEKADIAKMVTSMGGILHAKTSSDVSFVIVKNVLAQKYKWAVYTLKKPIVTINWLLQCWKEHRVVPQESYRVLPFSGLTICVSGMPQDERKEVETLVMQNGGKYSAEMTKKSTHLICHISSCAYFVVLNINLHTGVAILPENLLTESWPKFFLYAVTSLRKYMFSLTVSVACDLRSLFSSLSFMLFLHQTKYSRFALKLFLLCGSFSRQIQMFPFLFLQN